MKIKLEKIVDGFAGLTSIGAIPMSAKLAFAFQRNLRILKPEVRDFEKTRTDLVKENGTQNEQGGYVVDKDKREFVQKELNALLETLIDVDVRIIDIAEMTFDVSPNDLFAIEWMLTEKSDKPRKRHKK